MNFNNDFTDADFELFDRLRNPSYDEDSIPDQASQEDGNNECKHESVITTDEGFTICSDCGLELMIGMDNAPEWRYYKENDTKHSSDPSRCSLRKYEEKSIYRDLESYNIPRHIIDRANESYSVVTEDSILRGSSRKGLIFACIYYAYEDYGERKSQDEMKSLFNVHKKILSSGMKMFNLKIKRKAVYTSPLDFISKIMNKFEPSPQHIQFVTKLFSKIKANSAFINRSNPDSIAAALCYYFFKSIKYPITLSEFSKRVGLSDITVHKISKKIGELIQSVVVDK